MIKPKLKWDKYWKGKYCHSMDLRRRRRRTDDF